MKNTLLVQIFYINIFRISSIGINSAEPDEKPDTVTLVRDENASIFTQSEKKETKLLFISFKKVNHLVRSFYAIDLSMDCRINRKVLLWEYFSH